MPKALVPEQPYASFAVDDAGAARNAKPLEGMRIAILREHMVKETAEPRRDQRPDDREIKTILRDRLGAEIVETRTPDYPDDPAVPNSKYSVLGRALGDPAADDARDLLAQERKGELCFAVPGYDVTSYDYLLKLAAARRR